MTTEVRVSFFAGWRLKIYSIQVEIKSFGLDDSRGTKEVRRCQEKFSDNPHRVENGSDRPECTPNIAQAVQDFEFRLLRDGIGKIERRRIRR